MIIKAIKGALQVLIGAYTTRVDQATQLKLALNETVKSDQRNRASIIQTAMSVRVFWWIWAMFALPLAAWWSLVMLDTMTPAHVLNLRIPMLPDTIKPYADQIFNNIFYSGVALGTTQSVVRGVLTLIASKR